MVSQLSIYRVW